MTTYFDDEFARVWIDHSVPCAFTSIARHLSPLEVKKISPHELLALRDLRRKSKVLYSITDLSACTSLSQEMILHYMDEVVVPGQVEGYLYKLFIKPERKGIYPLMDALDVYADLPNLKAEVFDTFESAMRAINGLSMDRLNLVEAKPKRFAKLFFGFLS